MNKRLRSSLVLIGLVTWLMTSGPGALTDVSLEPIVYTIKFPQPDTHTADVEAAIPTGKQTAIEVMMAVWSPGFYRVENYADRVQGFAARSVDGAPLAVEQPLKNRWRIQTGGRAQVVISYRLLCSGRSVTTNWVGSDLAVLNGPATFITLVEKVRRRHDVKLELPAAWRSMTSLEPAENGSQNYYRAPDFDTLADSPIVAGNLIVNEFDVHGSRHYVVDAGDVGKWESKRAAQDLEKIAHETRRFWGFLPFRKYVFLTVFRPGGGGLEHLNSTLLTANSTRTTTPDVRWLSFVSHEYFHAFNVKRLRPIELGPFDYEHPPNTTSLWISEGLTTYFGDLMVARAGLGSAEDFLSRLSSNIRQLQSAPGRLAQTLEQASLDVWNSGTSGIGRDTSTKVSYYVKGPVVGFLLDAKIQRATRGKKSLDDLMRLAYKRYSGERGFTAEQFRKTAEEVAGVDLKEWFRKALASTEELDYTEALEWFGLRFAAPNVQTPATDWKLEMRADATEAQKSQFRRLVGGAGK